MLLAIQVLCQERSKIRTNAAAPLSPTVDRVIHTPWGHIPRRRPPPVVYLSPAENSTGPRIE